jgi:hypothetical protein
VRHLFHHGAPTQFQAYRLQPCPRSHNPPLRNGKLEASDKEAVRTTLQYMKGKFAQEALKKLDTLF